MNADLARALQIVEHDLLVASVPLPEVRDGEWSDLRAPAERDAWPSTAAGRVWCFVHDGPAEQLRSVADQVQEWVHEEQCRLEQPVGWPRCPGHPRTHPLSVVAMDELAWWVCPVSQWKVAPVGRLGVTARPRRPTPGGR